MFLNRREVLSALIFSHAHKFANRFHMRVYTYMVCEHVRSGCKGAWDVHVVDVVCQYKDVVRACGSKLRAFRAVVRVCGAYACGLGGCVYGVGACV